VSYKIVDANVNSAPYPQELADLVDQLEYRPGWTFSLEDRDRGQGSEGLTFVVLSRGYDTYNPDRGETYQVYHYFIVPAASYGRKSWQRWILDRLLDIESHECCEFMQVDGDRPFAPNHGPGRDPYQIVEMGTIEDASTKFTGEVDKESLADRKERSEV
jgi:hypothetical protein